MMTLILTMFVALAVLLIYRLLTKKQCDKQKMPSRRVTVPERPLGKPSDYFSSGTNNNAFLKQSVLESHPSLAHFSYQPVLESVSPMSTDDIGRERMAALKNKLSTIKPIPAQHFTLMRLLKSPESNVGEISTLIMTNPVFSAIVLQTINSAYFNLPDKIASVGRAITLLGFTNVRSIVLQDALHHSVGKDACNDSEEYINRWTHAAAVSVCSGYLGNKLFQYPENELATIGLLHDIGKYFIRILGEHEGGTADGPLIVREEQRYGINHAVLGSIIAHNWQLSDVIAKTIEYHHHPAFLLPETIPEPYRKHCFIINLSDLICKAMGYEADCHELLQIKDEYFDLYKLNVPLLDFITPELIKKVEKAHHAVQSYVSAR